MKIELKSKYYEGNKLASLSEIMNSLEIFIDLAVLNFESKFAKVEKVKFEHGHSRFIYYLNNNSIIAEADAISLTEFRNKIEKIMESINGIN